MSKSTEYLLLKLAEECIELAKEAHKAHQFGLASDYEDGIPNYERLNSEFNDLMASALLLNSTEGLIFKVDPEKINAKINKMNQFRIMSCEAKRENLETPYAIPDKRFSLLLTTLIKQTDTIKIIQFPEGTTHIDHTGELWNRKDFLNPKIYIDGEWSTKYPTIARIFYPV